MSRARALIEAMTPMPPEKEHIVSRYKGGKRDATVSGMGRNKGTLDHAHGKRSAQRHAKEMRSKKDGYDYKVEKNLY